MSIHRVLQLVAVSALCASVLAACGGAGGSHPSSGDAATAQEQRAVDGLALKKRYPGIVSGTDVRGNTLAVYVDVDNLYSMDEDTKMRCAPLCCDRGRAFGRPPTTDNMLPYA